MAKTIKFNLILDNHPVRTIEGLQEHFSIEDMLKYFSNGLLTRWLKVRGYESHLAAVEALNPSLDNKTIITELIKIFEVSNLEDSEIEKSICILNYLAEEDEINALYRENGFAKRQIIDDYHSGYDALIIHMEEHSDNMAILKADAIEMERQYFGLFTLNYFELYFRLLESAPKALFAILTRDAFRKYWISEDANDRIYHNICNTLLNTSNVKEILGDDLKIVNRDTQAMWDPIERAEVKVMVIEISSGTFVKNAGAFSEKLGSNDVNKCLLLFNGLEYQCNNEYYELLYMEV